MPPPVAFRSTSPGAVTAFATIRVPVWSTVTVPAAALCVMPFTVSVPVPPLLSLVRLMGPLVVFDASKLSTTFVAPVRFVPLTVMVDRLAAVIAAV